MPTSLHSSTSNPTLPPRPIPSSPHVAATMQHAPGPVVPAGAFSPGTKVQVGGSRVVIERYLSEGGFALVYLVKLPSPIDGVDRAVLKRVAVPDKEALANMRTEVETMKKLKGHRQIVTYFDSHASQLQGGGYEVFLLMEYCAGGGLIDFMNTRLQNRLTEPEILKIFSDTAQGVACMHYLKPPLLHRDLKVENILISSTSAAKQFKLCDFGSAAVPRPAATTAAEGLLIEEDIQKHTTMQYRSPEMIDVYRKQPIDEKSDIWALGVLLYKLCYYTTPFEEKGQMAILNASFKYPAYPPFSDRLKKLIAMTLQEQPQKRPNIYQVIRDVCAMRGTDVPIKDIYSNRTSSEARKNQSLPNPPGNVASPPPKVGAYKETPVEERVVIPDIAPMRRGRPTNLGGSEHANPKPSPSPRRVVASDPFAALDGNLVSSVEPASLDEASSRFPSLDHFSLLHDSGNAFAFDKKQPQPAKQPQPVKQPQPAKLPQPSAQPRDISQRVTEALADDAFASLAPARQSLPPAKIDAPTSSKSVPTASRAHIGVQASLGPTSPPSTTYTPTRISNMVSTGTMTSQPTPPTVETAPTISSRPIFRIPTKDQRSSSQPGTAETPQQSASLGDSLLKPSLQIHRSKSQTDNLNSSKVTTSSRPSLESQRPSASNLDTQIGRSRSTNSRARPVSTHLESAANYIQGRLSARKTGQDGSDHLTSNLTGNAQDGARISSNVDFLRAMEEDLPSKRREKRSSSGSHKHAKRSSLPSISLSGTKNRLAGRFGEAFRRFENSNDSAIDAFPASDDERDRDNLTPIAGSEATDGRSDDGYALEETTDQLPEVRRELERRRLSQEERRVAEAGAAYKLGIADGTGRRGAKDSSRAASIQNKVQALLDESSKASPTKKTAEGYGRYTKEPAQMQQPAQAQSPRIGSSTPRQTIQSPSSSEIPFRPPGQASIQAAVPRPSAPPKPQALRTGGRGEPLPPVASKPSGMVKPMVRAEQGVGQRQMQGQAGGESMGALAGPGGLGRADDWETSFSKKYPSLAGLEMVETEIEGGTGGRKEAVGREI